MCALLGVNDGQIMLDDNVHCEVKTVDCGPVEAQNGVISLCVCVWGGVNAGDPQSQHSVF